MDKNIETNKSDKKNDLIEKFQYLLDKYDSNEVKIYAKSHKLEFLTMDNFKFSQLSLVQRKQYIWDKLSSEMKIHPLLKDYILVLTESLKVNSSTLFIIEDNIKMVQELAILKDRFKKIEENLGIFLSYKIDNDDIKFSEKDLDAIIYSTTNSYINKYIKQTTDDINHKILEQNKIQIGKIRRNYNLKLREIENKYKLDWIKLKSGNIDLYNNNIEPNIILNKLDKIRKSIFRNKFGKAIGQIKVLSKDIIKRKYKLKNKLDPIDIIFKLKDNIIIQNNKKEIANGNIIKEESDEDESNNSISNEFKTIHNSILNSELNDLIDINKQILFNNNKNYINKSQINNNININNNKDNYLLKTNKNIDINIKNKIKNENNIKIKNNNSNNNGN